MDFNDHSSLRGYHALLSPSYGHWENYDEQKMQARLTALQAAAIGIRKHNWAHEAIRLGIRQQRNGSTLSMYINDGIGYRMTPDVILVATDDAFGEADTLSYREEGKQRKPTLRVSDLKTGITPAKMLQVELYAAFFYLEYRLDARPEDSDTILRIYQNDKIIGGKADPARIRHLMTRTMAQDALAKRLRKEME